MSPSLTPRPLADTEEVQRRIELLHAPHINPLTNFVIHICETEEINTVPWFDPLGGGINSTVLMLLQDPSNIAQNGTHFISPDNPDPTANNTTWFRDQACLHSYELVHWNIIPWKMTKSFGKELTQASQYLRELLRLLPKLKVVVCMGKNSEKGWNRINPDDLCKKGWVRLPNYRQNSRNIIVLACPHPSNQGICGANAKRIIDDRTPSQRIIDTLKNARFYLDN